MSSSYDVWLYFDKERPSDDDIRTLLNTLIHMGYKMKSIDPCTDSQLEAKLKDNMKEKTRDVVEDFIKNMTGFEDGFEVSGPIWTNSFSIASKKALSGPGDFGPNVRYSELHTSWDQVWVVYNHVTRDDILFLFRMLCISVKPVLGAYYYINLPEKLDEFVRGKSDKLDLIERYRAFAAYIKSDLAKQLKLDLDNISRFYDIERSDGNLFLTAKRSNDW